MDIKELKDRIEKHEKLLLLDVREAEEVAQGDEMPGAINMPMGKVFVEAAKGTLPKDEKIVAVCKSGVRCEIVARELEKKGYDIEYLEGGLRALDELSIPTKEI